MENKKGTFSNIKGDIPFESIDFDNGISLLIEYISDENASVTNYNGRFTSKYRKIRLYGRDDINCEKIEENPFYDEKADILNDQWQQCHREEELKEDALQIIHEGLSLEDIKSKVSNKESYLVVLWKEGNPPLPVDLGYHRDITLSLIDNSFSVAELTFNVINIVRSKK